MTDPNLVPNDSVCYLYITFQYKVCSVSYAFDFIPVLHNSTDYIHFLLDHWAMCGIFENEVLLVYTLDGISSVADSITA